MDRSAAKQWQKRMNHGALAEVRSLQESKTDKLKQLLQKCLGGEAQGEAWEAVQQYVKKNNESFGLANDEPGVVFVEQLATKARPRRVMELFEHLDDDSVGVVLQQWDGLLAEIPIESDASRAAYVAVAQAYVSYRASALAQCLEERFIEGGNSACSRGDLYLTLKDRYYLNFSYLCGEFGVDREEAIQILRALADLLEPSEEQMELLGGEEQFVELLGSHLDLDGDTAPQALGSLLPLKGQSVDAVVAQLSRDLISHLTVSAVSRRLGFVLPPEELLEIYEFCTTYHACGNNLEAALRVMQNLYEFEPDDDEFCSRSPTPAWQKDWNKMLSQYGREEVESWIEQLLPVYKNFSDLLGATHYRLTAGWQATCLSSESAADWIVVASSESGIASPICASSLLHSGMSVDTLRRLTDRWEERVNAVPVSSVWTRDFTILVLRYGISRQRSWLLDRLTDLYLRGGGYEAGQTRELISGVLEKLLDDMRLSDEELSRLESSGLHFELLPLNVNVFTGETVDDSRWASPTSANKYVKSLLRLEDRGNEYLPSLISERRIVALEKSLRRLDFHTSIQQIVASVRAFGDHTDRALQFLMAMHSSTGERPPKDWLPKMQELFEGMDDATICKLLWDCYKFDNGDSHSLNPGLFWAMRLVPNPSSVSQLGKAATEMVRRKPSFAIAALDTLDSIGTRSSLSAILQMRRRIRNRKVTKLINRTIDRIANEDGLDRDVFLDCAVDTGDLERDSSRLFDFGSHQVTLKLELDSRICTTVLDSKGRHLRSFPKTAKDADPALYKEFQATKKLLTETLAYQIRRLEQSMIDGRTWLGRDFVEIFTTHPVMRYIGRRLIWARVCKPGTLEYDRTLMPAEDGFVNSHNEPVELDENDRFFILHPLYFNKAEQTRWIQLLDSLGIEQPFAQAKRETYRLTKEELQSGEIKRLVSKSVDSNDLYRIVKERNWSTDGGGPWEVGSATHSYRAFNAAQQVAHVTTNVLGYDKKIKILSIYFTNGSEAEAVASSDVSEIVYSEAFRDIYLCFEAA
ncbi:MAG: DUF4132 domain-containing protein [Bradymonadales bacterium]